MADLLQLLLAGQMAGSTYQTPGIGDGRPFDPATDTEVEDIPVTGRRVPLREVPEEDYRTVAGDSKSQVKQNATPELIRRRGMFGVGGTLRDVLGAIGDAFLVSGGRNPVYRPQREKEKLASAQYGFTDDPRSAIERVGELDPESARELWKTSETLDMNRAVRDSQMDARQAQIEDRKYKMQQDFSNYAARLLAAADTPAKQAEAIKILSQRAKLYKLDLNELGISEAPTDDQRAVLGAGDMTVNQQLQAPLAERRVAAQEANAESSRIRANRPPAARAAPNPTAASMIAPIVEKIRRGQPLTRGEQQIYNDLKPGRSNKRERAVPKIPDNFFD